MGGRWHGLTAADRAGFEQVAALVRDVLGESALGAYVHGSATLSSLRQRSDLDVLAVAQRPTTRAEKEQPDGGLYFPLSSYPGPPRAVELTIVTKPDVRPWRYPPRVDFKYGEWLRDEFERGIVEPAHSEEPDLVTVLTMVLQADWPLFGPPVAEVLDPVPPADYRRAIRSGMDDLAGGLRPRTRATRSSPRRASGTRSRPARSARRTRQPAGCSHDSRKSSARRSLAHARSTPVRRRRAGTTST